MTGAWPTKTAGPPAQDSRAGGAVAITTDGHFRVRIYAGQIAELCDENSHLLKRSDVRHRQLARRA
jgi:hypothetical protein